MSNDRLPTLPPGNRGQSVGLGSHRTPRKSGAEFNAFIRLLEQQWQLGLSVRDETWSPHRSANELEDKVYAQLKRYYFRGEFWLAVERFSSQSNFPSGSDTRPARIARLTLLNETIKDIDREKRRAPGSRAATPVSERRFNGGQRVLRSNQSSTSGTRPFSSSSASYHTSRSDYGETHHNTPDPGSPTDEDEPPPSPIASSKSAQRRVQASPSSQLGATAKKRPSDSSDSGCSPKLTRTSKGRQPAAKPPEIEKAIPAPVFKKPSISSFRSHQAERSFHDASSSQRTQPDMNRSFVASTVQSSFNDTMPWSQATQPDTANTSFSSEYKTAIDLEKSFRFESFNPRKRTSSTTMGSLDDEDFLAIDNAAEAQLKNEELNRSSQECPPLSSSTYGSVDEDGMLERSFDADAEEDYILLKPEDRRLDTPFKQPQFAEPSSEASPFNRPHRNEESPSKMAHYIRDIPQGNLFTESCSEDLLQFPYFILFLCLRLANQYKLPLSMLLQGVNAYNKPHAFLDEVSTNLSISSALLDQHKYYWSAWKRKFEGYTFKGRIDYVNPDLRNVSTPVFSLTVLPLQAGKSCRFQRKFGSDRFFYVYVPSFRKPQLSRFTEDQLNQIESQWKLWYKREHDFLGRKWRAFHIEPVERKKNKKRKSMLQEDMSDKRIVMFATEGLGIDEPMTIGQMLNWFFPFKGNMHQSYCKAYARFDLGLSQTIPTLEFKPSQVRFVTDMIADRTPEDTRFNDNNIKWPREYPPKTVMNDGCNLISMGAAIQIWKSVQKATKSMSTSTEPMPSAFQGRIGGAKGMWMISGEPSSVEPKDYDIWIQISDSQLKFKPHPEDLSDEAYDPHRLTFDYVNHSRNPASADLHISYIPILIDRGVPLDIITSHTRVQLDTEQEELLQLIPKIDRLLPWIDRQSIGFGSLEGPQWQGGMYQSLPEQIKYLLESGFSADQEPYLSDCLYRFIKKRQEWMESKLQVPLSRSTYVIGVADPLGVLEPGEVHMEFSTPFVADNILRFRSLKKMDILVSRQPACRRSDIQKVRAVQRPELSHLIDVVVFPTKGQFPLAGKLQGGDYDGDTFWLCWDQAIVKDFKNAPAPLETPDPAAYGIDKDSRKLSTIMDCNGARGASPRVDKLLGEALDFRIAASLLGRVTNFAEKVAYMENRVQSARLDKLYDMHDLLVDAPKNGYKFTDADFRVFTREFLQGAEPKDPAYKRAMKDCEDNDRKENEGDQRERHYKHKRENVLDNLYFDIIRSHNTTTLKKVQQVLSNGGVANGGDDPDSIPQDSILQYPYLHLREQSSKAVIQSELDTLIKSLKAVERKWLNILHANTKKRTWFSDAVEGCYSMYCSILPEHDDPEIHPWVFPYKRPQYSVWEEIRASTFYTVFPKRNKLVWYVAGKQLAELKAASYAGSTMIVPRVKAIMKPKPPKVPKPEETDSDDDFESAVEDWTASPVPVRVPKVPGVGTKPSGTGGMQTPSKSRLRLPPSKPF